MSQAMNMMSDMAVQNAGQANLDTQRSRLENLSKSQDQAAKEKELRKAAEGFEAIFIQKMWDEMRSSLPKNGINHSKEEEYWQSMYSQELGKSMASVGGIGLADMMVEQLTSTKKTPQTGQLSRIRMAVKPAPLLPENGAENQAAENKTAGVQNQKTAETKAQKQTPVNTAQLYEEVAPRDIAVQNVNPAQSAGQAGQNADSETAEKAAQIQQPQVVHKTYITNLPPDKRTNALLDAKGNPIKKADPHTENTRRAHVNPAQRNTRANEVQANFDALTAQNLENIPEMPIVMPQQPLEQSKAEPVKAEPADMLAGISTTYIPYQQRIAMILASEGQRQEQERLEAERVQIAERQTKAEPAFRLPSLEDALRMGTLVASLSPEEQQSAQAQAAAQTTGQDFAAAYPEHIGGGAVVKNPPVAEFVSALAPQENFAMPVDGNISSPFGWRIDPINHARAWHTGLDIQAESGSRVTASMAGTVTFAGEDRELGNMIVIDHGNGIESVYGHNSELLVKAGDTINSGTQIAKVGSSGRTNGSHLHFEIRQNGLSINPEPYFTKEKIS